MTATRTLGLLCGLSVVLGSAGCNFAPHYEPPKAAPAEAFKEAVPGNAATQGWKPADPRDADIRSAWWEVYQDPELNELESKVAISNQTVAAAEANYRVARAMVREAEAAFFPTVSLDPAITRSRPSTADVLTGSAGGASNATPGSATTGGATTTAVAGNTTTTRTIYSFPLEASYQVDLWGSVRNQVAQNRYAAQASAAQVATALLSTQSQLAQE
jgi:outer membrane protein TolC